MNATMTNTTTYRAPMNWERSPFFGGCHYHADGVVVTGYYSPRDPVEFEGDCSGWTASNVKGVVFASSDEAMAAAEQA